MSHDVISRILYSFPVSGTVLKGKKSCIIVIIYILRNTHQKAVVNFHTQTSSSHQRSERCFSHVKKKIRPIRIANDVNFTMIRLIRSRRCVRFGTKFPPFIGALSLQRPRFASASQTFNEKRFSPRAFLFKKVKNISEIGVE